MVSIFRQLSSFCLMRSFPFFPLPIWLALLLCEELLWVFLLEEITLYQGNAFFCPEYFEIPSPSVTLEN